MIGASKILTVSYGTFSCTLEGFDDPFNTMRAIAEYFRDLAAEDRYFGAEPPTPDAAMLHKIAERELNRRVEANIQENSVILRAGDAVPARTAPAVPRVDSAATMHEPATPLAPMVAPTPAEASFPAVDSVATRLQRLREAQAMAEVAMAPAVADADDAEELAATPDDPWAADTLASVMAELAEPMPEEAGPAVYSPATPEPDAYEASLSEPAAFAAADMAEEQAAITVLAQPEEPVSEIDEPAEADFNWPLVDDVTPSDFDDIEPIRIDSAADETFFDALAGEDSEIRAESSTPDAENDRVAEAASDDDLMLETLGTMIDPEDDGGDFAPAVATPAPVQVKDEWEEITFAAGLAPAPFPQADEEPQLDVEEPVSEAVQADPAIEIAPEAGLEADPATDPLSSDRSAERLQRARARVIKIRRIDVAAPSADTGSGPAVLADATASALSPEAEAELMRELADLEADLAPEPRPAAIAEPAPETEPQITPSASSADDAVNRLISQTNAAMEGPENKRRLAAIAHLKAAVAATFADRKANAAPAQPGPAERMDPYRDDLDRVVRPRRPALIQPSAEPAPQPSSRPKMENRPAPLVLVSEQRIDRPAAAPARPMVAPVRPRRVTTDLLATESRILDHTARDSDDEDADLSEDDVDNIFADPSQPFAEFAERLGAVTMPDLMEAAAAYCALQLGRDQFTRPLLLQQIAGLPGGDDFNREDCLRGFGTLLRDGRIQKIKRGQFKLSGHSRYLADGTRQVG